LRRMQNLPVNLATASARKMKLRNSLFHMMLCSAATLHLAVDAKISPSNRVVLPGPSGKTTTVQSRQRPQFKAPPENGGMLTEASTGALVAAHVTSNGELAHHRLRRHDHGEIACPQVGPLQFPRPRLARPRRDSNPRTLRSGASALTTHYPRA
jgi:hypothetical protein